MASWDATGGPKRPSRYLSVDAYKLVEKEDKKDGTHGIVEGVLTQTLFIRDGHVYIHTKTTFPEDSDIHDPVDGIVAAFSFDQWNEIEDFVRTEINRVAMESLQNV